jgi:subtilisin family serine protease
MVMAMARATAAAIAAGKPATTGRLLVAFPPEHGRAMRRHFRNAGLHHVAAIEDHKQCYAKLIAEPSAVMHELGIAVVDPRHGATARAALEKIPFATVREEHVLTRVTTTRRGAATPPTNLDWLETDQSWALSALGIRPRDQDGDGILVAVIDSGVTLHPDIRAQVADRISLLGGGPDDTVGHGTHCAGLIAGSRVPARGLRYGVAPNARVLSIRVFDADETAPEATVRIALYAAAKRGCRVISLAAGRLSPAGCSPEDVSLGRFLVAENCVLMAAAGNDSDRAGNNAQPTRAPANAPFVPAIGALTPRAQVWNDSNGVGDDAATRVDFLAPGTSIVSAWMTGGTMSVSGTSAATAIAAGFAAAVWSRAPHQTASDLLRALSRMARRMPHAVPGSSGAGYLQIT